MLPPLIGRHPILAPFFHAPTHRINPEYTIGERLVYNIPSVGPGPGYYLVEKGLKANGKFLGYPVTIREKFPLSKKQLKAN